MRATQQNADSDASCVRPSVRIAFWAFVVTSWAIVVVGLAGVVAVATHGGRPSGVSTRIARADSSTLVLQRLGEPSERGLDGQWWAERARPEEGCVKEHAADAWLYRRWFAKDALVIFDPAGRVHCIHEGGAIIVLRSY